MPINRLINTKNFFPRPAKGGVANKANPANYDASSIHIDDVRVYGKNTASYLLCGSGGEGYRFGYGGHEKVDEVSGSGNTVDMGDRWLDVRLGRTHKLDRHRINYPAVSPYAYALNSPLLFNDPDGKDARITVQKDPNGGGKIIISSTVYITGKGANSFNAEKYTQKASQLYQPGTYTNEKDEKFEIVYEVKFEYVSDITTKIPLNDGDNILEYVDENVRSQVFGEITGDIDKEGNVSNIKSFTGNKGLIGRQDAIGSSQGATIHETLHFLGLSDRYEDDVSGKSQPDKGFGKDLMGSYYGTEINQTHFENIGKVYSDKDPGTYVLKEHVDIKASDGSLIGGSSDGKRPIPEAKK